MISLNLYSLASSTFDRKMLEWNIAQKCVDKIDYVNFSTELWYNLFSLATF